MEGACLWFSDAAGAARLLRLTVEAERRNRVDTDRASESSRWVHRDPEPIPDVGLPRVVLGPQDTHELLPMRDFTAQRHAERLVARVRCRSAHRCADHRARPSRRLAAGGAGSAALWLLATAHGLRASLLHQALEWPDLRRSLSPVPGRTGHAQMLIRFGYGPEGPASPRPAPRTVLEDVLASR